MIARKNILQNESPEAHTYPSRVQNATLWEKLFVSENSPLRELFQEFEFSRRLNPFRLMHKVKHETSLDDSNKVEFSEKVLPNNNPVSVESYQSVGAYLALFSWFGVTDLHKNNMMYKTINRHTKITPLSIECIFNDIYLPSQTLLAPKKTDQNNHSGFDKIFDHLKSEGTTQDIYLFIKGYIEYLLFLNTIKQRISTLVNSIENVHNTPIRVLVKNDSVYLKFFKGYLMTAQEFEKTEVLQLKKSKIPYYFHYLNENKIYFYNTLEEQEPIRQNSPIHKSIHKLSRRQGVMPSQNSYRSLLERGALQLARLLLPKDYSGTLGDKNFSINAQHKIITIKCAGEFYVECES